MLSPRPTRDSTVCSATTGFAPPASCLAPVRQASPALPVADADPYEFSLLDEPLFSRRALDLIAEMATEPTAKGGDVAGATTPPREDSPLGVPQEDLGANTAATSRKRPYDEIANPETGQRLLLVAPDRPDRPGLRARLPEHQARAPPAAPPLRRRGVSRRLSRPARRAALRGRRSHPDFRPAAVLARAAAPRRVIVDAATALYHPLRPRGSRLCKAGKPRPPPLHSPEPYRLSQYALTLDRTLRPIGSLGPCDPISSVLMCTFAASIRRI